MSKKKKHIKYTKERAIISDVLPYEIPITFSNRYFYRFLIDNKIEFKNSTIKYKTNFKNDNLKAFEIILKILFSQNVKNTDTRKIPFTYRISHKEKDFRELALVHPINQLELINFYEQYKESILYSCSLSNYSIRKPDNIAKFTFFNDKLHQSNKGEASDFLELSGKEYENLKTFFSYSKYTNIYQFFEDYRYQRAEKKYNQLFKFDISKCFDSIYTHSISWAVLGLDVVKENVNSSNNTFSGKFDKFIQYANYGETNGILIGPEFSRIFAEIILQKIDTTIEKKLKENGNNYKLKVDYELYRYVDDYFLFCDNAILKDEILKILKHELKKYKLSINNSKTEEYNKPIITEITIAKNKIIDLFSENPKFKITELEEKAEEKDDGKDEVSLFKHKFELSFNPNKLATHYKIIIKESQVDYKDVLNYSLALLSSKVEKNLISFEKIYFNYLEENNKVAFSKSDILKLRKTENLFTSHIVNLIDFIFFIYSVSPRVNSTIKVSLIFSKIIQLFKEKNILTKKYIFSQNNKERVFKKILDESSFILKKNSLNEYAQVESLYLLTLLRDLGKEYRLPEEILVKFLNATEDKEADTIIISDNTLNYFSIVVLFYYIGHSQKFYKVKEALIKYTINYIEEYPNEKIGKSSEMAHLILDLFACPFLGSKFKIDLLHSYRGKVSSDEDKNKKDAEKLIVFHKHHKYWFTKWERFNLAKELENKKSQEVYS
ncbi:RNA-directed DNA polymerase [Tenacibaculum finnmarkense]|uniref:antiviral reverse transcriptase Drt3b n=1 Tax=Tenacibaculum finnmarkense TaxID=2781243 RepID=UPI001EFB2800|nr:antiviral reverse transcriptase Drt3b [Tenacibaculum finnmarkense]MCG8805161.1 RNA-directed DNA polymerase [Tenacibaculum finnmarkense]MCG8855410.1 RNA-directed DNA polymerase [Tenacibaculum finnmarkense]